MVALSTYDLRYRRLPNWLTLPGAAAIGLYGALTGRGWAAVAGAAALCGLYLVAYLVNSRAMGGGDVKLAVGLGGLTGMFGADVWALAAIGAPVLTAAYAAAVLLRRGGRTVPHGPSMCLSSVAAVAMVQL
jgi:leader peptidase (prepilin peptidase) / N-methyltransferase